MGNRVTKELLVPKKQHGGVYNDGWFGSDAAWSPDESRLAYVAEVSLPVATTFSLLATASTLQTLTLLRHQPAWTFFCACT